MAAHKVAGETTLLKLRRGGVDKGSHRGTARSRASATDKLRGLYRGIKEHRIAKEIAEQGAKDGTREAVALATDFDLKTTPITFDLGGALFVGEIISPNKSDTWDLEKVVEFAHKQGIWEDVSTRVFDQDKWEAEVSSGNVRPADANKMKIAGGPGTPYVKIVKK